jgi:hypothetical protein
MIQDKGHMIYALIQLKKLFGEVQIQFFGKIKGLPATHDEKWDEFAPGIIELKPNNELTIHAVSASGLPTNNPVHVLTEDHFPLVVYFDSLDTFKS